MVLPHNATRLLWLIGALALAAPALGKTYKWVDDQGVTHYGETVPPEYAGKDRSELNPAGRVVNTRDVLTPEEREAKQQAELRKRQEAEALQEQRRKDKALMNTYSSVGEIELARSRNLQQVEARLKSLKAQITMAQESHSNLRAEEERYRAAGKPVPASLHDDLGDSQARLERLHQDHQKGEAEKALVNERFNAEIQRYRELTGQTEN